MSKSILNLGFDLAAWYNDDGSIRLPIPNQIQAPIRYEHSYKEACDRIEKLKLYTEVSLPGKGSKSIPGEQWFKSDVISTYLTQIKSNYDLRMYNLEFLALNSEIKFLYPIHIFTQHIFRDIKKLYLSTNLVECIKRGQAKIHLSILGEGFLFDDPYYSFLDYHMEPIEFINSIHSLMDSYELPNNSVLISSSNLRSNEIVDSLIGSKNKRFKVFELDWFRLSKWSFRGKDEGVIEKFNMCLNSKKFAKHFLSMNRASRPHRTVLFTELCSNPKLKDKVDISFTGISQDTHKKHLNIIGEEYKYNKQRLLDVDCSNNKILDIEFENESTQYYTIPVNLAFTYGWDFHNSTFVNIVSETLVTDSSIFLTEKIHKPIISAQPFVVVGNPFYLKKMRELGYKTFSNFWDESYDLETDFTKRFEKIVDTLEHISSWDLEKCYEVYNSMIPILKHNFNTYMDTSQHERHLEFLYNESLGSSKSII